MAYLTELWRRLLYLGHRARFHAELSDEMEFHIASRAEELQASGVSPAEAMAQARREFGSAAKMAEDAREAWQFRWLEDLFSDVRYSARALRRNPGFALAAVFCLALGIGANTTIFNIATSFLLSQPSGRDMSSVISIQEGGNSNAPPADYRFLRDAKFFAGMAGIDPEREVNWRNGDRTTRLYAALVTDDYFATLGIPCEFGRGIAPGETDTVVLSNRLWRTRFAADPTIPGRRLVLDGKGYTVAGVLPADHRNVMGFGFSPDIYVPLAADDTIQIYARMPTGMTVVSARVSLQRLLQELDRISPMKGSWKRTNGLRVTGVTGLEKLGFEQFTAIAMFFGVILTVAILVLLIACTNVASLLLARASSRSRELAIRVALGAGRMRIVRHLLAESLVLAGAGALAGFLITVICGRLLSRLTLPLPVPIQVVMRPDERLLVYAVLMAVLSAVISGLIPALRATRKDVNNALKHEERQTGSGWGLRGAMVMAQAAVSVVLLVTGLLFIHNLLRATAMNPGFDIDHAIWTYMRLVPDRYKDPSRQKLLVDEALARLRALPGVAAAAIVLKVPLNDNAVVDTVVRTDLSTEGIHVNYEWNAAGPDYFRAIGIPIVRGREFRETDSNAGEIAVIVNQTFARIAFGNTNPIGHSMMFSLGRVRVIGVVRDSRYFTLGESQRPALYDPYFAHDEPVNLQFIVRTAGSPAGYVKPIQEILGGLDPTAAIETKPMMQSLGMALLPSQAGAAMFGAMGLLGLVLAAIGLYGGLLYAVSRRTREIGLRVALGETSRGVLGVVCRSTMALAGSGMLVGLALAVFATRPLAMFLVPGMSSMDPVSFAEVTAVFIAIALLATIVPAVRALQLDPMTALRYD